VVVLVVLQTLTEVREQHHHLVVFFLHLVDKVVLVVELSKELQEHQTKVLAVVEVMPSTSAHPHQLVDYLENQALTVSVAAVAAGPLVSHHQLLVAVATAVEAVRFKVLELLELQTLAEVLVEAVVVVVQ
jgi:hypothetical protein